MQFENKNYLCFEILLSICVICIKLARTLKVRNQISSLTANHISNTFDIRILNFCVFEVPAIVNSRVYCGIKEIHVCLVFNSFFVQQNGRNNLKQHEICGKSCKLQTMTIIFVQ